MPETSEPVLDAGRRSSGAGRRRPVREHAPVLAVIGLGGGLGALARYGLAEWIPARPGAFPMATFVTNVTGCFLIGLLMVAVTEAWSVNRLVRPFLGVGILGGYTTFSTYTVEIRGLLRPGSAGLGFAYLAATLVAALFAVALGMALARWVFVRRERAAEP